MVIEYLAWYFGTDAPHLKYYAFCVVVITIFSIIGYFAVKAIAPDDWDKN